MYGTENIKIRATQEKDQITYKGGPGRITPDF